MPSKEKTVLICLCGHSPAVITETIYCLATEPNASIPSEVIAITTSSGREFIKRELFDSGLMDSLRRELSIGQEDLRFSLAAYHIRVIMSGAGNGDAEDILTSEDNRRASDFMLNALRAFTDNPETRVVLSIAGGRKTMGAMAALCMSLLGRRQDRLCHVLVNPPFDDPRLTPKFYFPRRDASCHRLIDGGAVSDVGARLILCDIPFVRMRYQFQDVFGRLPGTYSDTVGTMNKENIDASSTPPLKIDTKERRCMIGKAQLRLSVQEFVLYWMLAERSQLGLGRVEGEQGLLDLLCDFISRDTLPVSCHSAKSRRWDVGTGDARKLISSIAAKLRKVGLEPMLLKMFQPRRAKGVYGLGVQAELIDIS